MKTYLREVYRAPTRASAETAIRNTAPNTIGGRMHDRGSRRAAGLLRLPVHREASLSATTTRLMVFKLVIAASKTWRRLKSTNQLPNLIVGIRFQRRR